MSKFSIQIPEPYSAGVQKAIICVDGREFLDIVPEFEEPIAAAAGEAGIAGSYRYLNARDVLYPSRHLLGAPFRPLLDHHGKVSILECDCGCEGCWPLVLAVDVNDNQVIWRDFQQPHRDNWIYPGDFRFVFERSEMESAIRIEA
jgi:hypothetical protein